MRDTPSSETVTTLGAIAIELAPGSRIGRSALPQSEAGDWAAAIATDLARVVPGAAELDLVLVAALYDPAELLRPHFPRHAELDQLAARAPGEAGGRIIAFGAAANGLPPRLVPDAALGEGPLRVVPLLLRGSAAAVEAVGAEMEARLLDVGMANAATALATQAAFGLRVEHMRYLTLHDLMAMMAMQYEHAGVGALWPMVEAALFGDDDEILLDAPPEPLLRYANGRVHIALMDADAWALGGFAPAGIDADRMEWLFERFEARQRQMAAVLGSHGIEVIYDHCPIGRDARAILRAG
ncbi:MAG: hypothetical protein ACK5VV_03945 [Lysobacteraceae bacterium]|jgi:hypothetical protein|nr:hypothetical protein [Xanthomonadaceae bacterium]MCZ8317264.1 hypothetical protein [Silanimonas sp.]